LYSLSLGRADRFYPETFELLEMGSCPVVRFYRLAKKSLHISKIEGTIYCRLLLTSPGLTAVLDIGNHLCPTKAYAAMRILGIISRKS